MPLRRQLSPAKPIEIRSPGSPIQRYVYDAKGRQVIARILAPTSNDLIEITRTEAVYDNNDRAIATTKWDRKAGVLYSETTLTTSNSVRSYMRTWYDHTGRGIATANLGTAAESYAGGDPPMGWDDPTLASPLVTSGDIGPPF